MRQWIFKNFIYCFLKGLHDDYSFKNAQYKKEFHNKLIMKPTILISILILTRDDKDIFWKGLPPYSNAYRINAKKKNKPSNSSLFG